MTNRIEIAPSPDYAIAALSYSTDDLTVRHCCDCGDICLTVGDAVRCDPCQATHLDELATAKRVLDAAGVWAVAVKHLQRPGQQGRSGGMNDPREILCEECGECALTYTGNGDSLDRAKHNCDSCGTIGVIDVDQDDDGHVRVRFLGAP